MNFKTAIAQTELCENIEQNIKKAAKMSEYAAMQGASVIVFPEVFLSSFPADTSNERRLEAARKCAADAVKSMQKIAKDNKIWLIFGMYEPADETKNYNTTVVINDKGNIEARYRKTHLYDAFSYKESDNIVPGRSLFTPLDTPFARIGIMVCYEVRFPEIARYEALNGCDIIFMPTAWFEGKGKKEQLELLTRCRALENTVFVAMSDICKGGRSGMSMIVDPLGNVLASAGEEECVVIADIDTDIIKKVRKTLPVLENIRPELYK